MFLWYRFYDFDMTKLVKTFMNVEVYYSKTVTAKDEDKNLPKEKVTAIIETSRPPYIHTITYYFFAFL